MSHFKQSLKALLIIGLFGLNVMANDKKHEAATAEAAPEAGATLESAEYSGQQDDDWMKLQDDVVSTKTKLDAQQAIVTELLVSKKNNKGRIGKDQVDQLNSNYQKLQEIIKDYNQKLNAFEIKYPEKGQALGRQYNRKKEQSIEQMESSLTLDGRIRKINKKIKAQFGVEQNSELPEKKMPQTSADKKTKPAEKISQPVKVKDDITEKIIIVK
ncbi:MAG: hypothetical protein H7235_12135 [Bdellovibrionaceae bacterium]|nr:hypothetical protein [Pseudobdellovibrionaceae bacterium]